MYVTTLVAIVSAVFAPFLRGFDSEQQLALLIVGLIELICFVGGMVWTKWQRDHAKLKAGRCEFRTSFYDRRRLAHGEFSRSVERSPFGGRGRADFHQFRTDFRQKWDAKAQSDRIFGRFSCHDSTKNIFFSKNNCPRVGLPRRPRTNEANVDAD